MEYRIIIYLLSSCLAIIAVKSSEDVSMKPKYCHWGPSFIDRRQVCVNKCDGSKGFIHPKNGKFICTEDRVERRAMPIFGEPNEEGLYDCECKHPTIKAIGSKPKIILKKRTVEHCYEVCGKYLVLTFLENKVREAYFCEASSVTLHDLEFVTLTAYRQNEITGEFYRKPLCKCGLGMDQMIEKGIMKLDNMEKLGIGEKLFARPLVELPHLCHIGGFPVTEKFYCENQCQAAKAFLDSSNELICYHNRIKAVVISPENEDCECGAIIPHEDDENKKEIFPCFPKQTLPLSNQPISIRTLQCTMFCQNTHAYIFKLKPNQSISYCDKREQPPEGIEGLEFQDGRYSRRRRNENKEFYEFKCTCGVNSLSRLMEERTNEDASSSKIVINRESIHNCDSANHFQLVSNLGSTQNSKANVLDIPAVANKILKRNPNENASYLINSPIIIPPATNQIPSRQILFENGSFPRGIPNQRTTLNSNINASFLQVATNERNTQNHSQVASFLQLATNPQILENSNGNASLFQTTMTQTHTQNLIGSVSSSESVTYPRSTQNLNRISRSSQAQGISERPYTGGACENSSGAVTKQRTTDNSNRNISSIRATNGTSQTNPINSAMSSRSDPYQRSTQNSNTWGSSLKRISNQNNNLEGNDDVSTSNLFGDLLEDESFVKSLDVLPFEIPDIDSLQSISDFTPVEDRNIPSHFAQLPQPPLQKNTNNNETCSLSRKHFFADERISSIPDSTKRNTNNDDDMFGKIMKDISINRPRPQSLKCEIQPMEIGTSEDVPVGDRDYPLQYYKYILNL